MEDGAIKLSVLVTREEYCEATAQARRKQRQNSAPVFNISGAICILAGVVGLFFGRYVFLSPSAAICLVIVGLFLVCYVGQIAPVLDKAAAAREFEEKEDLRFATVYTFSGDRFTVQNGRIKGELPLSLLTRWNETPALFSMAIDRELNMVIPKRMMTPEQIEALRALLKNAAEGVNAGA